MMFVNDSNNLAGVAVLLMIVIFILNIKFLIHWTFYMSFTLAGKYKLFCTIFMVIGMILCKRAQAEKMLEKEGISYKIPNEDDANANKIENIDEDKKEKVTIYKKIKNIDKRKKRKKTKFQESNSDIDRIQRKHRSKKKKKQFTNKSKLAVSKRSSIKMNPMVESVFDETFDNYVPDSRNQMISIDDRIRSIRRDVMNTDD